FVFCCCSIGLPLLFTLFPYTTLFRSAMAHGLSRGQPCCRGQGRGRFVDDQSCESCSLQELTSTVEACRSVSMFAVTVRFPPSTVKRSCPTSTCWLSNARIMHSAPFLLLTCTVMSASFSEGAEKDTTWWYTSPLSPV